MVNIVLFGPPGAGKGTQAKKLAEKYGYYHISTGEILRSEIRKGTELGKSVEASNARGEFAPDDVVIEIVSNFLENHSKLSGNIFDGFPRTAAQAERLDRILVQKGMKIDMMLSLEVPEKELVERIMLRGHNSGRADDLNEEIIGKRMKIYNTTTAVIIDYYKSQGKFIPVDGTGSIDEIFDRLCRAIETAKKGKLQPIQQKAADSLL